MEQAPDIFGLERQLGSPDAEGSQRVFDRVDERCMKGTGESSIGMLVGRVGIVRR